MPRSLIDEMAAKGWFGVTIPAEHGGMGSACSNTALSRRNLPALGFRSTASWRGARDSVPKRSTNARRLEQLRRSAQGKWIGAIALSEPTAGSDLAAVQTRAIRQDGYWLLSRTKRWAGFALAADFIEVLARTREPKDGEPRSAGLENISRSQTATHLPRRDDRARQNWLSRLSHLAP